LLCQLAAQLSLVDLNDRDVIGGEQTNFTLGLNWYLTGQLRVQANLIKVLPPIHEVARMAGVKLPEYLGSMEESPEPPAPPQTLPKT